MITADYHSIRRIILGSTLYLALGTVASAETNTPGASVNGTPVIGILGLLVLCISVSILWRTRKYAPAPTPKGRLR